MPVALACVIGNAVCAAVIPVVGVKTEYGISVEVDHDGIVGDVIFVRMRDDAVPGERSMSSPCPCTPTIGTRLAHLMTRLAPTPAPIAVATFVILFPSGPSFTRQDITLSCPRAYGLANTQAECGHGATLCLNRSLVPRIVTTPQEFRVFPPPSTSLMSLSQANWWPERAPSR